MAFAGIMEGTSRHDLKTCPEGFIEVKRLTFGQKLHRQDLVRLSLDMGRNKGNDIKGEMAMANVEATFLEFSKCIVSHNLERAEGVLFNFNNRADFELLDPRVGEEISKILDSINNFEDSEEGN